jgi:hypothetical protein
MCFDIAASGPDTTVRTNEENSAILRVPAVSSQKVCYIRQVDTPDTQELFSI